MISEVTAEKKCVLPCVTVVSIKKSRKLKYYINGYVRVCLLHKWICKRLHFFFGTLTVIWTNWIDRYRSHRKKYHHHHQLKKPNGYDPQKDHINTLDRRNQTTIFRLRTGHCGLRKHLKRLGLADSAHCECGSEEQTPEHILQTCPHLETVRQQFWPEDAEEGTKRWGKLPNYSGRRTS